MQSKLAHAWVDLLNSKYVHVDKYLNILENACSNRERVSILKHDNDRLLIDSITSGNANLLEFVLQEDIYDDISLSLMLTSMKTNPNILRLLLEYGVTPHKTSDAPLLLSIKLKHMDMFKLLLNYGAAIDCTREYAAGNDEYFIFGYEVAYSTIEYGNLEMFKILLLDHVGTRMKEY